MKSLTILILALLLLSSLAYAQMNYQHIDLDGDGKEEIIAVYQQFEIPENILPFEKEGTIAVYNSDGEQIGRFSMPDRFDKIEFVSLNKDGVKQIVAWSSGGMHYTNIAIYGYKDSRLYKIFENGSGCAILTDFNSAPPKIKVGIPKFEEKGWSYADEPDWEIWAWGGKEFKRMSE